MRDEKQRFSLRKLSVGLASVLIGITFLANSQTAKADVVTDSNNPIVEKTDRNVISSSGNAKQNNVQNNTQVNVKIDTQVDSNAASKQDSNAQQNGAKINTQAKIQTDKRVEARSTVPNNAQNNAQNETQFTPNNAQVSQKQSLAVESANSNTVTTTFDLNKINKVVSADILRESKIEDTNNDLNVQTDPSKLTADKFMNGTRWTPAGWTSLPTNIHTAKNSKLTMTWQYPEHIDSTTGRYVDQVGDWAFIFPGKLDFTIDKNDMKTGNQILVQAIQEVPTQGKQAADINKRPYLSSDSFAASTYAVKDSNNNVVGNLSVNGSNLNGAEIDVYFTPNKTIENLATDPTFSYDFTGSGHYIDANPQSSNPTDIFNFGNFYSHKNNLQYPLHYSVISSSNVLNYDIQADNNYIEPKTNVDDSTIWSDWGNWDCTGQIRANDSNLTTGNLNNPGFVYKIKVLHGNPLRFDWAQADGRINLIDSNGKETTESAGWGTIRAYRTPEKVSDNLSSIDLWNQTANGDVKYSMQSDGSALICDKMQVPPVTQDAIKQSVDASYLANVQDPSHYQQILDNSLNKIKGWQYYDVRFGTGAADVGQVDIITDVTPDFVNSTKLGSRTYTPGYQDGKSQAEMELYRNAGINYVDDDDNENIVSRDSITGRKDMATNYTVSVPQKYVLSTNTDSTNYKWSPDKKTITYTFQDDQKANDNDPIVIHLKHKHETVVGSKGDTIDLYQTHTRTVHYVYDDGSKAGDDNVQSVLFTRSADKDLATGKLSNFTPWVADNNYGQINVPIIHGYTPSQTVVQEQNASPDHDVVLTVTYNKNKQQINVSYVDDTTGATLDTKRLDGYSGDDAQYSTKSAIDNYKARGYELVSDPSNGAELIFDKDDFANNQEVTVHLKHATEQSNLTHNITRTIHYVYADGTKAHDDSQISTTFNGVETIDRVTGKTVSTVWTPETHNFSEVASPLIPGYTANRTLIEDSTVTPTSDNIVQTVTYNPNKQNIHVTFIDDTTGNTLNSVEKSGYTGTDSGYSTKDDIDALIAKGYKLVSDGTPKDHPTLMFDSDDFTDDQNFTVHMEHDTKENNLTREVSRTIHYVYRDGKPAQADKTDSVQFTGVEKIDKVDGHVISTVWTPENKEFSSIATPSLNGYTPDKFGVDSVTVKPNSDNITITVTYNPDTQYSKFNYIDDTTGNELTQETSHGVTGARDNYSTANLISYYKNKGYDLASDDTQGKTLTFDNDDNTDQVYAIHFTHGITTIDPQNPGKPGEKLNPNDPSSPVYPDGSDNLTRNVERKIDYVYTDGRTAQPSIKDSLTFNNTEKIDRVTGKVISSIWDGPKDFADIATPVIEGYTPDKSLVENKGVNHDSDPIKVVITYSADPQHMSVIYRDLTDNRVLSQFAKDGVSDEDSHYNTKSAVNGYLADGYVLSSDSTNGKDLIFDHNDKLDQTYYVDFIHGTHVYNPEKPNAKDKVNKSDYLADYNTVISYVDPSNKKLSQDKMVTDEYKRDLTVDSVNGNIIKRGNWELNKGYALVENPVIAGYITNATSVKPQDRQKNQTINVVYQTLGKIHLVDNKGQEIAKAFSYTNDPTDPTKVLVTKVPSVAGYEQVTFSVDPRNMPTKDTTVVFNAPAQVVINYVDSVTNKTIHTDTVKGFATHTSDYATKTEIADLVKHGYVLTHDNVPTSIKLTEDPQNYTVTFVHGISKISHDNPQKEGTPIPNTDQKLPKGVDHDDLNREIVRTITVIDPHTGNKVTKQTAKLFRDATVDNVTGTVTYTDWNKANWDEFTTPVVAGYTPSAKSVVKTPVDISTKPVTVDITYTANPQKGKISYIDENGKEVGTTDLNGKTDEDVKVIPVIPHGWVIVDGQTIPTTVKATADGIPTVSIKIKHGQLVVTPDKPHKPDDKMPNGDNYPKGVSDTDLNRNVTRQIILHMPTGDKQVNQIAKYTRVATIDLVTGKVTYTDWSTKHGWDEYVPEIVNGYEHSIKKLDAIAKPDKDTKVEISYMAIPSNDDSSNGTPITLAQPITPSKPTEPNVPDKPAKPAKKSKKSAQSNKLRKQTGRNSAKRNSNNGIKLTPTSATITANNGARNGAKLDNSLQKGITNSVNNTNLNANSANIVNASNANSISNVANNASQLPQTGSENDKTAALAGILLASIGIATAIGVSRKKRS